MTAKPEEQAAIAKQIQILHGKSDANKYITVGGGQEWDTTANVMRNVPGRVFDTQARQFVEGQQQTRNTPAPEAAITMLKGNPAMAKEFDAKYGEGASARALAAR